MLNYQISRKYFLPLITFLIPIIGGMTAYIVSIYLPPIYQGNIQLVADATYLFPSGIINNIEFDPPLLEEVVYKQAAYSDFVIARALKSVGLYSNQSTIELYRSKSIVHWISGTRNSSDVYILSYKNSEPKRIQAFVDAWARSLKQWDDDYYRLKLRSYSRNLQLQLQSINSTLKTSGISQQSDVTYLEGIRSNLIRDLAFLNGLQTKINGPLHIIGPSSLSAHPISPKPANNAFAVTFLLSVSLFFAFFVKRSVA